MASGGEFALRPVGKDGWDEFEAFFSSKSILRYCWCMEFRMTKEELRENTTVRRKAFMKQRILTGVPVGLIGYLDGAPVAWCSVGPRETFRNLHGDGKIENVWSLTCLFIAPECRGKGFAARLIDGAAAYARENGAQWLEAYPVLRDSPSYRHMGFLDMFEKAGFAFAGNAGTRRHVMTLKL